MARESVRIAFLIVALNDVDILVAYAANAYLHALCREKAYTIYVVLTLVQKMKVSLQRLCKLNMVSSLLALHVVSSLLSLHGERMNMVDIGSTSCLADPDVWHGQYFGNSEKVLDTALPQCMFQVCIFTFFGVHCFNGARVSVLTRSTDEAAYKVLTHGWYYSEVNKKKKCCVF
jgi:hypothetical protein